MRLPPEHIDPASTYQINEHFRYVARELAHFFRWTADEKRVRGSRLIELCYLVCSAVNHLEGVGPDEGNPETAGSELPSPRLAASPAEDSRGSP